MTTRDELLALASEPMAQRCLHCGWLPWWIATDPKCVRCGCPRRARAAPASLGCHNLASQTEPTMVERAARAISAVRAQLVIRSRGDGEFAQWIVAQHGGEVDLFRAGPFVHLADAQEWIDGECARAAIATLRVPTPEVVHAVCPYINGRKNQDCRKCPRSKPDPHYGEIGLMCFALAEEAIQFATDAALAPAPEGTGTGEMG